MIFTLIRGFFILLLTVVITYFFSFIEKMPGSIILEIQEKEFKFSIIVFLLMLLIFGFLFFFSIKTFQLLIAVVDFFMGKETALLRFFKRIKYRRSQKALNNAIIALVEGENQKVLAETSKALLNPDFEKAVSLIKAKAEENLGNQENADKIFKRLLPIKETRLAALDGLIRSKISRGDLVTALELAKRSVILKPKNNQSLNTLFKIQVELKDWMGARKTIVLQQNLDKKTRSIKQRQEALVLYAEALKRKMESEELNALETIKEAIKKSPDLVPAVCLASDLESSIGKIKNAEKYIRSCWKINPHPDLAKKFANLYPEETPKNRLNRFSPLFKNFNNNPIVRSIKTELLIASEEFPAAKRIIQPLIKEEPNSSVLMMMASIEKGLGSSEEIIQSWISKAFYAPRPPVWFCEKCNYSENWSPVCKKCKSFDSMTWGAQEINNVFSENKAILPFEVDNKTKTFERKIEDAELVQVSKEEENRKNEN